MIVEGLITTLNDDGTPNVAPMGPIVDDAWSTLLVRPFRTSTTYKNLRQRPTGVFHVTDDVLLLARAAIDCLDHVPEHFAAERVPGVVLASTCRWYEFVVEAFDEADDRTNLSARVVHQGRLRDFLGFNRARHAVIEAAILASRVHLLPHHEIQAELSRLRSLVTRTGGPAEHEAFGLLERHVAEAGTAR